ncbi:hypothetical protein TraAM80_10389 [Trypanosoma rangeli]|uniref:Uncharacterized protein n=1 Tax=Trypanosoma rangeli TaxID=5698 RepID=A0A422MPY1_TRYRA|nr:uncharacterized protein TraAM80_10389 [Trypanosoma rangeli]RNE95243.1 hypothetical protein TraAM80_10389 [Trypanosoma rangeli]|eukprot:RNE95243.1 hypothetical protein TraAM80_10389 [Trypanosoma rangeli]
MRRASALSATSRGQAEKGNGPKQDWVTGGLARFGRQYGNACFPGKRDKTTAGTTAERSHRCFVRGGWRRASQFTAAGPGALPKSAPKSTPTQNSAPEIPQWNLTRRVWAFSMLDRLGGAHEFKEARVPLLGGGRAIRHHSRRGERGLQRAANTASV